MSNNTNWMFPLLEASENKRTARIGLQRGEAHELIGVDGSIPGGLRPIGGFRRIRELDFYNSQHDTTSVVNYFQPVNFRIGSSFYGYGFVYRSTRKVSLDPNTADVFVDFWNSDTETWSVGNKVMTACSPTAQMHVEVWGRFVFIFVEGRSPAMFYLANSVAPYTLTLFGDVEGENLPGPGKKPLLFSPEEAITLGTLAETDIPDKEERPAAAQIVLTQDLPSETTLFDGAFLHCVGSASSAGDADETFQDADARLIEHGDYVFAYYLYDPITGRRSALSEIAQVRDEDFGLPDEGSLPGSEDDSTVETDQYAALEIVYDSALYTQAYIYRSVKVQDAGGTISASIKHLDAIINLCEYNTNLNGEGLAFDPAVTDFRHSLYYYRLEDKQMLAKETYLDYSEFDEQMPPGGAAGFYENTMLVGKITAAEPSTTDEIRIGDGEIDLGEIRWSSLVHISPELFPPRNRYIPRVPSNEAIRFIKVGGNMIAFSRDRMYHVRKESIHIKLYEMHEGFGLVSPLAADAVGTVIFFVTPKGVKSVSSNGQLDEYQAMNSIIIDEWRGNLSNVSVAYDPHVGVLFVHNPDLERTVCMWFNTSMVTEIYDTVFDQVGRGVWPVDPFDSDDVLTERAMFLQNSPTPGEELTDWKPRIFILDHDRARVIEESLNEDYNDQPRITTLDLTGDTRFEVDSYEAASGTLALVVDDASLGVDLEGAYVYIIEHPDPTKIGLKAQIVTVDGLDTLTIHEDDWEAIADLETAGTKRIAISPVYFRWTGHPVGLQDEQGMDYAGPNFFRIKQLDSVKASFTDVTGPPTEDEDHADAKFRALAYRGSEVEPRAVALPRDQTGDLYAAVENNEGLYAASFGGLEANVTGRHGVTGNSMTPSIEVICPDLDFRLVQAHVSGKILGTDRSRLGS